QRGVPGVTEAKLVPAENGGVVPEGGGWFVLNAKDARGLDGTFGQYCAWEGPDDAKFDRLGRHRNVLPPGGPVGVDPREDNQEGFLVLDGECLAIVEGEERPLKQWDYFHCPGGVPHVVVGAGDRPSLVLAVGARTPEDDNLLYPVDPTAVKHKAGVEV